MSYGYMLLLLLDSSRLSMLSIIHAHFEIPTQSSPFPTLSLFPPLTVYKDNVFSKMQKYKTLYDPMHSISIYNSFRLMFENEKYKDFPM